MGGGGVELKFIFKLKLEMFYRKVFFKNEDKYLFFVYYYIIFFLLQMKRSVIYDKRIFL